MEHETIKNDFFTEKVKGPTKELSLSEAIEIAVGRRLFFSKRLAPAGTICNARVYTEDGQFVFSSDINVFEAAKGLSAVADAFGVELFILHESGNSYYWRSSMPTMWCGGAEINGEWSNDKPHRFEDVKPGMEEFAAKRHRQWGIDHGLVRRNPMEWFQDGAYRWKNVISELRYYMRNKELSLGKKAYYMYSWLFRF